MKELSGAFLALVFMAGLFVHWGLGEKNVSRYAFYIIDEKSEVVFADRKDYELKEQERLLFRFIDKYFIGPRGEFYTRIQTPGGDTDTLSESVGLLMEYCVLADKRDLFNKELEFLKQELLTKDGYIRWKTGNISCNAAIDDLRIVKALLDAYNVWGKEDYYQTAADIQKKLYERQTAGGILSEFHDWSQGAAREVIPLCYLDLDTLRRLRVFNEGWERVSLNGLKILENGRLNGNPPFYYKYYDIQKGVFLKDEEYAGNNEICMIYTLYSALHMAEADENTDFFTRWLKEEMAGKKLYGWYNPDTLKPSRDMESTAVYALGALYAEKVGDGELYGALMDRMLDFMVTDPQSSYYGGFGNKYTGSFYSFDNLLALLALASAPAR